MFNIDSVKKICLELEATGFKKTSSYTLFDYNNGRIRIFFKGKAVRNARRTLEMRIFCNIKDKKGRFVPSDIGSALDALPSSVSEEILWNLDDYTSDEYNIDVGIV